MKFSSNHQKLTASLVLLGVLALTACGQGNEKAAETTPASQTPATTNTPAVTPAATPAANTTATTAGVSPKGTDCPSDAPIKGVDTTKRGKIYHTTTYPDYKKVKATICFKDVASAEKAGYKLPQAK
ncbi:hypothetical protein IQ264_18390 [Phormidium sp. LEGE 05292]|uniref:sunset domain-containing protein n=1 Tax=[Phormidium] sp. LEGE 05292 TaxID=767427 RepID=UPI0018823272|nr:hypothetical protein [Phormidium sp. LEGE 05292]MBE9227400.1 hypothetical protein [Phormidium sp. LEGE 05292]